MRAPSAATTRHTPKLLRARGSLFLHFRWLPVEGFVRLFGLSFLIVVACAAISSASAQERLKVITSGQHLKDWRFKLCDTHGCVNKVVLCAPGYHIIYGDKCVANIHTPPSWEDQVQPVVPPCEGCGAANPSLYSLYVGSAWPQR
jgi:hypothetical protein